MPPISASDSMEKYNPNKKSWTKVSSSLQKRMNHTAGVLNGKIYVMGYSELIEVYDPLTNTWSIKGVLPKTIDSSDARFFFI